MVELSELVNEWLRLDRNPSTHTEIQQLWDTGKTAELEERLRTRIQFGTAGLRGKMEAGWARMNDLTIIQASQGLASYVITHIPDALARGVVIGNDHRHNSQHWAKLTAAVFIKQGMKVYLLRGIVHTPMVPFSVKRLQAACGVMITASHNPKEDNGYKVYWENAVQIIEPHDQGISESIRNNLAPQTWDISTVETSPHLISVTQEMHNAYFASLLTHLVDRDLNMKTPVRFVNTSMHGVSDTYITQAFEKFGFAPYIPVEEQQQPNPDFPTVRFPNPEEKGALNLAIAAAEKNSISYILAQDPDSDRFSGAERDSSGRWTIFTGDQLGTLFAYDILERYKRKGNPINKLAMIASVVSSKMIEAMAKTEGFNFTQCLTGFKYIGNKALDLAKEGYEVPFGYEEAIGFMFGDQVRDKDGVAAAMVFSQIVAAMNAQGKTLKEHLDSLYEKYGYYQARVKINNPVDSLKSVLQTNNGYFVCRDSSTIKQIFEHISNLNSYPIKIAGLNITAVLDLTVGYDSTKPPLYKPSLPLSSGYMIQFRAEDKFEGMNIMLTIRTSGTEPKIKYYLEGSGGDRQAVEHLLTRVVRELEDVWMEPGKWCIKRS